MKRVLLAAMALSLAGCALIPSPQARLIDAERLAAEKGWRRQALSTNSFTLTSFVPSTQGRHDHLVVYIEGDGFAWLSGSQPSADPTPRDPVGLKLALAQPGGHAVYLARPCQFSLGQDRQCNQAHWTNRRFSPEVVDATLQAIDQLKQDAGAHTLTLVGYSGGGTVASLVAVRRADVQRLVTVAGNLDVQGWIHHHHLQALDGSLDPADQASALSKIRQWHFVGDRDQVVPAQLTDKLVTRYPGASKATVKHIPDFDHACCWAHRWPLLWEFVVKDPA